MRNIILILFQFTFSIAFGQEVSQKELNYKPINLEEAVFQLKIIQQDSTKQKIMSMSEKEFLNAAHFGLGMWIRNNWNLWKDRKLANYFKSVGIYQPDDMSAIILTSYYRELHEQDWKVEEQIQYYQDYLKKSSEHLQKHKTDVAYQKKSQEENDSILATQHNQKKLNKKMRKKSTDR